MWELDYTESWAQKNWCFWTVMLEKTLESPRRSNQSILKEISPEYSLEGLMLKLKFQYFGHLMWRADSLEKTLMLGKIEGRRRGQLRMSWLNDITGSRERSLSKLWEVVKDRGACWATGHGIAKSLIQLSDWTTTEKCFAEGRMWSRIIIFPPETYQSRDGTLVSSPECQGRDSQVKW